MDRVALCVFVLLIHVMLLHSAEEPLCPPDFCNEVVGHTYFPFRSTRQAPECGMYTLDCSDSARPRIQLKEGGYWHQLDNYPLKTSIGIKDTDLESRRSFEIDSCNDEFLDKLSLPIASPTLDVFVATQNLILFKCNSTGDKNSFPDLKYFCNNANHTYYHIPSGNGLPSPPPQCSIIKLPTNQKEPPYNLSALITTFNLRVETQACYGCLRKEGECLVDMGKYKCFGAKGGGKSAWKLGLGIGLGGAAILAAIVFILWRYKKIRTNFLSRNISFQPNTNSDIEGAYFGVPVFTYNELEEATDHFNSEKELGDGGFGTVYYGKLKDGREVAVKRLYEHNYKRVEQFMNEIEILTRLRHPNLVSLYGCTSRRSRELLLVYEYIPNGTVADHLHGDRAQPGSLTWPIRMSIAIETASALSYLHASEIIHRDVKTTNILLDSNFSVKVADFGLSRLFPLDVTHVSTAPQGTPGYVDPEYHQCYQLTSKSDVYSFGVVLIELISSMPAVDISRHRHEINLANLAMNKIQKGLFNELVDPSLGFHSDDEVRRTVIVVAELAFQCLQQDNDMRPTMNEVLETLTIIESGNNMPENLKPAFDEAGMEKSTQPPPSPEFDDVVLLKKIRPPFSPISVTQTWPSTRSTTPNTSV